MSLTRRIVQNAREAIVASLDTAASLVALTGRDERNIVPWQGLGPNDLPVIAYHLVAATSLGSPGDVRRFLVQFSAFAAAKAPEGGADEGGEALCNAMLDEVELTLTALTLSQLSTPFDARVDSHVRRGAPYDEELGAYRADLDLTMTARA